MESAYRARDAERNATFATQQRRAARELDAATRAVEAKEQTLNSQRSALNESMHALEAKQKAVEEAEREAASTAAQQKAEEGLAIRRQARLSCQCKAHGYCILGFQQQLQQSRAAAAATVASGAGATNFASDAETLPTRGDRQLPPTEPPWAAPGIAPTTPLPTWSPQTSTTIHPWAPSAWAAMAPQI